MRIALAADHAGFGLKSVLEGRLRSWGHSVDDFGVMGEAPVDYPDFAKRAALAVSRGEVERGVLVCGSGIGMAMAANRIAGVRAVNVYDQVSAQLSREHNNANVVTFGARLLSGDAAAQLLQLWLETPFLAGRHRARVAKIEA